MRLSRFSGRRAAAEWSVLVAALVVVACAAPSVDGAAAIARADQAMGGSNLKSIRYAAERVGYTYGQAFAPGGAWPKITVDSRAPDSVLGVVDIVTRYSNYRDVGGGVKFPGRIEQSMAAQPVLDVRVGSVEPNAAVDITVPDAVRSAGERVTTVKLVDGLWFVGGGSHNSVAIEMKDHLVLVEASLNDGRSVPVIDAVKALAPGKPLRCVINSHQHFDHAGGLRTAVAEGATIVTQAANVAYLERAFATPIGIAPDRLAASGRKANFMAVGERAQLSDGTRTIEIHRITNSIHNNSFLMVYLPVEKVLIEADAFTPPPPGTPPPTTPNANNVNLIANIERLRLNVDRIAPLHGRVVMLADLYANASKPLQR